MLGFFLAAAVGLSAPEQTNKNGWYTDYSQALAAARQQNRPLFVVIRCEH